MARSPLPVTVAQIAALARATGLELAFGLRAVSAEVARWRRRAAAIKDPRARADALHGLDHKRGHIDGAALFWTVPPRRDRQLVRALVAYEVLQDFLDSLSERAASAGVRDADARRPFRALGEALDPARPLSDWCAGLPWDARGYLAALVAACRESVLALPSFTTVQPFLARETDRAEVLHLNHIRDRSQRDPALRAWAAATFGTGGCQPGAPGEPSAPVRDAPIVGDRPDYAHALPREACDDRLRWFELTAAASGWITTHALLCQAAIPGVTSADVAATHAAYFPHVALTLTLLDSWADQEPDARAGDHNYLSHYAAPLDAVTRLQASIARAAHDVLALPDGERHAVLLACMIALYMSKDSARTPRTRPTSNAIVRSGGALPRLLLPVLRLWRIGNAQRAST
jgi:tetraprenyl-beta-curcumene synthase